MARLWQEPGAWLFSKNRGAGGPEMPPLLFNKQTGMLLVARGRVCSPSPDTHHRSPACPTPTFVARWRRWSVASSSERQRGSPVGAQRVLPLRRCLEWYLHNHPAPDDGVEHPRQIVDPSVDHLPPPLAKDDRALLERWLEHPDAEKIWNTIRAHSEKHEGPIGIDAAGGFILLILKMKHAAEAESAMNVEIAAKMAKAKKLKTEVMGEVARSAKQMPFEKRAEFLAGAGRLLQGCPSPVIPPRRIRSDRNGSRARTYFIQDLSGFIHDTTGRWLDEQVAIITAIAFNTDISNDAVRKARLE